MVGKEFRRLGACTPFEEGGMRLGSLQAWSDNSNTATATARRHISLTE